MSSKRLDTALLEVRGWTVDDVANVLQQNGLGDFEESFKKRNIDGDALLSLTEGMLVLWKRELGKHNIRKIGNFIEDVRKDPDKYCVTIRSKPTARRTSYRISSWNTVFDSVIEYQNLDPNFDPNFDPHSRHSLEETISETLYENQIEEKSPANGDIQPDIPSVPAKPPIPARPPSMRPRPKVIHASTLPVPPIPDDNEHLKTFISYIKLPALEEKDSYHTSESELYEIPNPDDTSESTAESWEPSKNHWTLPIEPYEEKYFPAEYESIKETNGDEYYLHPSAVDTSPKPLLETSKHQLRELPEAPAPPIKPKGLSSYVNVILPPSTVPPPRPLESKPVQVEDSEGDSFNAKSDRIEYMLKNMISGPPLVPGTIPKKEKVTGSTELKKSASSSTSSISSVTSIKTTSGQSTTLSDQRLPPNLRPLPPTPGTSSFRPVSNSNTLPVPIRKISNTKTGVLQFPWYHNVDRRRGEELVFNGEDGTFMIRPSSQSQNPYTLTIWFGKRVYNIGVRHRADGKYALGTEKQNEQSFRSVEEMVSYYQSEQLVLYSGGERTGQTALKSSPKKE